MPVFPFAQSLATLKFLHIVLFNSALGNLRVSIKDFFAGFPVLFTFTAFNQ